LDILRGRNIEQSRSMKVRSSVKKLCDGCKVRKYLSSSIALLEANPIASTDIAETVGLNSTVI